MSTFTFSGLGISGGNIAVTTDGETIKTRLGRAYTGGHNGLNGIVSHNLSGVILGLINLAHAFQSIRDPSSQMMDEGTTYVDQNGYLSGWNADWGSATLSRFMGRDDFDSPGFHDSLQGRYRFTWDGDPGALSFATSNITIVDTATPNQIILDITGNGNLQLRQTETTSGAWPTNFKMIPMDLIALYDSGKNWRPEYLALLTNATAGKSVNLLRFMDMFHTNYPTATSFSDISDMTVLKRNNTYVPIQLLVELMDEIGCDGWFCVPHSLVDTGNTSGDLMEHVEDLAVYLRDNVNKDLKVYIEFSNEAWNFNFPVHNWLRDQALAAGWSDTSSIRSAYAQKLSALVLQKFTDVYGVETGDRVFRTAGFGRAQNGSWNTPLMTGTQWADEEPSVAFNLADVVDVVSPASYFGNGFITSETERNALIARIDAGDTQAQINTYIKGRVDALGYVNDTIAQIATIAAENPARRVVLYEGGTHLLHSFAVSIPASQEAALTSALGAFSYSDELAVLYGELLTGIKQHVDGPFMDFSFISQTSKFGAWSTYRSIADVNPRATFLQTQNLSTDRWWVDDRKL